jgi:hypothetical protein
MRLLSIAKREMAEQKMVWAAALFVALAGFALPWVKGLAGPAREDSRVVLAVGLNLGFSWGVCAVLGASAIPSDLASRRMGFYLSRPVSAGAILWGRLLGIWLLALGGGLVTILPQVLAHPREIGQWAAMAAMASGFSLYVLLGAHLLGSAWRARNLWLLLGVAAATLFCWALSALMGRMVAFGAWDALPWLMGGACLLTLPVLAGAAWAQLALGRTDLNRGSRILALVLTGGLAAVVLCAALFTFRATRTGPGAPSQGRRAEATRAAT